MSKKICCTVLLLFFFVSLTCLFLNFSPVHSSTYSTYSAIDVATDDGYVWGEDGVYSTARTVATGAYDDGGSNTGFIGQTKIPVVLDYAVYRSFFKFNTTAVPVGATITAVKLCLSGRHDDSTTNFVIRVQKWTDDTPITTGDYNLFDGINYDDGAFNTASYITTGYNNITVTNFSLVTKGGYTLICVRSAEDIDASTPPGNEWVDVYTFEGGLDPFAQPILEITYTLNTAPTNDDCSALDLDSGEVLAWRKYYSFYVAATDIDGVADFNYVEFRLENPASTYTNVIVRWTESTDTFSIEAGSVYIAESGSSKAISGNQVQLTFKIAFDWDYALASDIDAQVYSLDDAGGSDTDTYNLDMDLINTVTTTPSSSDYRHYVGGSVSISGTVQYTGTAIVLPESQITSVVIHDSAHASQGSTTFNPYSVSITLPVAEASNAYHVYVDGSDSDFADGDKGSSVNVISDSLMAFNLQPVVYLGNGTYHYQAQIKYGYDAAIIDGAFVNVSLPSGSIIEQATSNSTGWITLTLDQTNASETGGYTIFGVDDNNYGITYAGANVTFSLYNWTLARFDVDGNALTSTDLNVTQTVCVWNGSAASILVPVDTFNVTVKWLQDLQVNFTSNIAISANTTTNLTCLAYPFTVGSTVYWVASNATISSHAYSSSILTVDFSGAVDTYIVVASCVTRPVYILNATYDIAACFTPYSYLVLSHYGNTTISVCYSNWGDTYVKKVDNPVVSVAWQSEQRLSLTFNGTGIGSVEVYCGSRGCPAEDDGFTTTAYASQIFTGTFAFASEKTVWVQWKTTGSPTIGGGVTVSPATDVYILISFLAVRVYPSMEINATIHITWQGDPLRYENIYLYEVKFNKPYENWTVFFTPVPLTLICERFLGQGDVNVSVTILLPQRVATGVYRLPFTASFGTAQAGFVTAGNVLELTVEYEPSLPVSDFLTILSLVLIGSLILGGILRSKRKARVVR